MAGFSCAVVYKIFHLQINEGEYWAKKSERASVRFMKLPATRGNILANDGSLLATSIPFYKLAMDPKAPSEAIFNQGIDSLCLLLSQFYGDLSAEEYKRKIKNARLEKGEKYIIINPQLITYQDQKKMNKWPVFRAGRFKGGAIFEKFEKRYHPYGHLAARTVGFVNENYAGVGLEKSFNDALSGKPGQALFRKLAGGHWKPIHNELEQEAERGLDIETTLDINLQDVAESSLAHHLQKHDADYGCVVLMEVKTGEIKAMANLGKLASGGYGETYNFAVGKHGLTDPGSTFKLATLMAIFEESDLALADTVNCGNGAYAIYDRVLRDAKEGGYGTLTVREVFSKSSNIGIARLMERYFKNKPKKFIQYLNDFQLNKPLNFQLLGEPTPYIKSTADKTWSGTSLYWMAIGYEMALTPLHTLTFYNGVANQGKVIKPLLVKAIYRDNKKIKSFTTETINAKLCSPKTLEKLVDAMVDVVENGTAKNIKTQEYKIAGKTGTAQIIEDKKYTKKYYTSFCGFFPANKPKYTAIVVISGPKGYNQMAGDVSAPVFREIADKIYALDSEMHKPVKEPEQPPMYDFPLIRAGYAPDLQYLCNELSISNHGRADEWVVADISNNAITWRKRAVKNHLVPNTTGMTLRDAIYLLENQKLKVAYHGHGRVQKQWPEAETKAIKGHVVYLDLD